MRSIAVINQKGGVGKTTTTTNLAAALAAEGKKVLAIDLDPQAHLTINFGAEPSPDNTGSYGVLTDAAPIDGALLKVRKNLWLLPSHIDLAAAEVELVSVVGREVILRDAVEAMKKSYDFLFIDCPPSLGILTINALSAVREVFIPLQPHFLALQGLGRLLDDTIRLVTKRVNPELRVTGVILTMFEGGTRLATEIVDDVKQFFESSRTQNLPWSQAKVFDAVIRRNVKLAEAPSHGLTIFDYEPRSNGALDYARLAAEVIGKIVSEAATIDPVVVGAGATDAGVTSTPARLSSRSEGGGRKSDQEGVTPISKKTLKLPPPMAPPPAVDPPPDVATAPSTPARLNSRGEGGERTTNQEGAAPIKRKTLKLPPPPVAPPAAIEPPPDVAGAPSSRSEGGGRTENQEGAAPKKSRTLKLPPSPQPIVPAAAIEPPPDVANIA